MTDNAGKHSPGRIYKYEDQIKFEKQPGWSVGTEVRVDEDKPRNDFYENVLFLDYPIETDISLKPCCLAEKIGT